VEDATKLVRGGERPPSEQKVRIELVTKTAEGN
jgi:hypothetical protein